MKHELRRISSFCCFSLLRSAKVSMMTPKMRLRMIMMTMKKKRRSYITRATNNGSCNSGQCTSAQNNMPVRSFWVVTAQSPKEAACTCSTGTVQTLGERPSSLQSPRPLSRQFFTAIKHTSVKSPWQQNTIQYNHHNHCQGHFPRQQHAVQYNLLNQCQSHFSRQ